MATIPPTRAMYLVGAVALVGVTWYGLALGLPWFVLVAFLLVLIAGFGVAELGRRILDERRQEQ